MNLAFDEAEAGGYAIISLCKIVKYYEILDDQNWDSYKCTKAGKVKAVINATEEDVDDT